MTIGMEKETEWFTCNFLAGRMMEDFVLNTERATTIVCYHSGNFL